MPACIAGATELPDDARLTDIPLRTSDKQVAVQRLQQIVQEKAAGTGRASFRPGSNGKRPHVLLVESVEEFIQTRAAIGRDEKYVKELKAKLLRVAAECSRAKANDITADSFDEMARTANPVRQDQERILSWPHCFFEMAGTQGKR